MIYLTFIMAIFAVIFIGAMILTYLQENADIKRSYKASYDEGYEDGYNQGYKDAHEGKRRVDYYV